MVEKEEGQNTDILGLQFGDACLVSVCHLSSLFSGDNTLLHLGRELWKETSPPPSFVVLVKHRFLQDWSLSVEASTKATGRALVLHLCPGRSVHL